MFHVLLLIHHLLICIYFVEREKKGKKHFVSREKKNSFLSSLSYPLPWNFSLSRWVCDIFSFTWGFRCLWVTKEKWRKRWIPQWQCLRTISGAQIQNQVLPKSLQRILSLESFPNLLLGGMSLESFPNLLLGGMHFFNYWGADRRNRWTPYILSVSSSSQKEWALAWGSPFSQVVS